MKNLIAEIAKQLAQVEGTKFASFTYLSKKANELARHTLILGFNYNTLVEKSVTELEILMTENQAVWTELQKLAAQNVMSSLKKTLAAHAAGEQNEDYTKKGQYVSIGNGLNLNTNDNTLQLFGLSHTKTVLVEGVYPTVNSRPLTIAQNEIKAQLSISKFREFALDLSQVAQCRINGNTLEMTPA
jgi:hypothetical protein